MWDILKQMVCTDNREEKDLEQLSRRIREKNERS
jgi:hypothetical protein